MRVGIGRLGLSLPLIAVLSLSALADTVTLKNGREIHGVLVSEEADAIFIRTGDGVIRIEKALVATFTEGDVWEPYGRNTPTEVPAEGGTEGGTDGGTDGGTSTPQGSGAQGAQDVAGDDWTWPAGLTEEEIATLTEVRDRFQQELEDLPEPVEPLEDLTATEEAELQRLMQRFEWRQRQGSAIMIRNNARDEVVRTLGTKAIPALVDGLAAENYWRARMSAEALAQIANGSDAELAQHHLYEQGAPSNLLILMTHQGDTESPFMRAAANQAMEAITGHSVDFPTSNQPMRTPGEINATQAWRSWWFCWLCRETSESSTDPAMRQRVH